MRLNFAKRIFSVVAGKFLGFMLTERGTEANADKCATILDMRSPTNLKEIQRLVCQLTSLSHFIPKLAERFRPIVKRMKRGAIAESWDTYYDQAFMEEKIVLTNPTVMNRPLPKADLQLYLGYLLKLLAPRWCRKTQNLGSCTS